MGFFASCQRHTNEVDYVLFTNAAPPMVDGFDVEAWLRRKHIRIVNLPIKRRLPDGVISRWGNQFYVIDIIEQAAAQNIGTLLLFDSDCFWIKSVDAMADAVARYQALTYRLWYDEEQTLNGLSRRALTDLYSEFFHEEPRYTLAYSGGEVFAANGAAIKRLAEDSLAIWEKNLRAIANGDNWCREEAQFLSLLYHKHGYEEGTANPFLKRIWTAPGFGSYRNTAASDRDLVVWHMPAEKRFGFKDIFHEVRDQGSRFWTVPKGRPFVDYAAATFGVGEKPWTRRIRDFGLRVRQRLATTVTSSGG